jgi:arabinosyltransferase C
LWGSLTAGSEGPLSTGTLTTPWFALPAVSAEREVTVSVAGRTDAGNSLALEFGRADPGGRVTPLGRRTPPDPRRAAPGEQPDRRLWRAVGVPAREIPTGSDRVRIRAVDATSDPDGWLAVTGPRLRELLGLREFLARHSPVLIAWPIAFLFPCTTNVVTVSGGLARAPVSVLEAPQEYSGLSGATTDSTIGGSYAALRDLGGLGEVTTRLAGHPELDWGDLLLTSYPVARDTYRATVTWTRSSGLHADDAAPTPPVRASAR